MMLTHGDAQVKFIQQPDPNAALAVSKPPFLTLLTNVGSKGSTTWQIGGTFAAPVIGELVDVFTCRGYRTSEDGHLKVESEGGMPMVRTRLVGGGAVFELLMMIGVGYVGEGGAG